MTKIKLTKGELKRQRDDLKQFLRYLPTLQLKKQQLQAEILYWRALLDEKVRLSEAKTRAACAWSGLLVEADDTVKRGIVPERIVRGLKNIAGVNIPVFERVEFPAIEYDLFVVPAWVDAAIDFLRELVSLRQETRIIQVALDALRRELYVTAQRVNLFEKVKIPAALEAIRRIKIHIGDQMANAVGRSKIAQRKIAAYEALEVTV